MKCQVSWDVSFAGYINVYTVLALTYLLHRFLLSDCLKVFTVIVVMCTCCYVELRSARFDHIKSLSFTESLVQINIAMVMQCGIVKMEMRRLFARKLPKI